MEEFKELKKEIKIKELTKIFKKLKVFENLSLSIEEGINIITGDNGSGKTTLLNLIGFIDKKYEGKIIRNFGELDLKEKQFYQAGGFLPQSFELPEHMKLIDFIHFVGEIGEIKNYEEKAENLIEVFGLEEKKKERINKLSGGMKQRAGIISVMMKSPAIV
jgi:ABC-type multidrug transport system ATPase subunit